jgi:YhcH/YjgK/YiaL family protein
MFASNIFFTEKYDFTAPKFTHAYEFLRRKDLAGLPVQTLELSGGAVVQVREYMTRPPDEAKFEAHDRMFDIQFVVSGGELFGLAPRAGLEEEASYDGEKDITFYHDPPCYGSVLLRAGDFIVVGPEDAHKPGCMITQPAPVKKIIVKIRVDG